MRNLSRLRNRYNLDSATVHVECFCRLDAEYNGLSVFLDAGGELVNESPLMAKCPRCQQVYTGDCSYNPEPVSGEDMKPTLSITLQAGDGDTERPRIPAGDCPACGSAVYAEDYAEGPGQPAIGWEHYECSDCGTGISPRRFDVQPPTVSKEGDDR